MDDYISREAAIKILEYARDAMGQESAFGAGYAAGLDVARNHILDLPAADVRPVVHGKWGDSDFIKGMLTCSNCGAQRNPNFKIGGGAWCYCPNCGAMMDGGINNDATGT